MRGVIRSTLCRPGLSESGTLASYCYGRAQPLLLALCLVAAPLKAQVVDSLAHYCPPTSTSLTAFKDTIVVVPTDYRLSLKQSIYLRAIQCGFGKVREVTKQPTIRWFSSDTSVIYVTFRTGRATALKPGSATVFAIYP